MNKEINPNISVGYGNGIGKVEFNPKKFSVENLRRIVGMQINSTDSPIIGFLYRDGQTRIMGKDDILKARALDKIGLSKFITKVTRQMDRVARVFIVRKVEDTPYHSSLSDNYIYDFIEGIDGLDDIR